MYEHRYDDEKKNRQSGKQNNSNLKFVQAVSYTHLQTPRPVPELPLKKLNIQYSQVRTYADMYHTQQYNICHANEVRYFYFCQ